MSFNSPLHLMNSVITVLQSALTHQLQHLCIVTYGYQQVQAVKSPTCQCL